MSQYDRSVVDTVPPVPPDKVRLCEYGQAPIGTIGRDEILEYCRQSDTPAKHRANLMFRQRGYYPAGSVLRWSDRDVWGVVLYDDRNSTTYGRWYLSESEAREHWVRVKG